MSLGAERSRTLDDLDPPAWGEPTYDSHLVKTCHALRRKPLRELAIEDLRILIGQRIGLSWLIPLALEALEAKPLAEGDFYAGDLLAAVLSVGPDLWVDQPRWRSRTEAVLDRLSQVPKELNDAVAAFREAAA
jgi:hypothetical protein